MRGREPRWRLPAALRRGETIIGSPGPDFLMTDLLQKLPSTMVLGVLAAVFLVTCRKHSSMRIRLWVWGWGLVLSHFAIRLLDEGVGLPRSLTTAVDLTLLLFAGLSFAISSSPIAE